MAQGGGKKYTKPNPGKAKTASRPQQQRVSKPQKPKGSAVDKLQRKFTAGLIAKTEKMLGARAGHLELIGKGKKADKAGNPKGGTRKFG